ncbi:MAG TPA: hypothetical protein VFI54_22670 [Solirubrobacteraceae bacterium]|nr:hypothetical protein [Solirubrobacteraceae bacterium]
MQAFPKRKLVIGSTVLAVAAFAGGAVAATQGSSKNPRQQYLDDVAKRLNVTPAQLDSALKGAALDQLAAAVKAGKLTQAQANALKQRIQQGAAGGAPFLGPPRAFGPRGLGPGPLGLGLGRAMFFGPDAPAAAVAKYLGLTEAQLVKQIESGKSLADIAKAQGKTPAGLEQAITAAAKARLDKAVANNRITAAQEQQMLKALSAGIDQIVNSAPPKGAPAFGFGFAFGGGPGKLGLHRAIFFGPNAPATAAAKYLGLTKAQLRHQLQSGKSLAQIAKAQGKTTAGLEQAISASIKARLDKAVANKRITAAQEQKILKALSAGIDDMVNNTAPKGARFGAPGFGYHKSFRGGFARPGSLVPAPPAPAGPFA